MSILLLYIFGQTTNSTVILDIMKIKIENYKSAEFWPVLKGALAYAIYTVWGKKRPK